MLIQTKYEIERMKMLQEAGMAQGGQPQGGQQQPQGQGQQPPPQQQEAAQQQQAPANAAQQGGGNGQDQVAALVARIGALPPNEQPAAITQLKYYDPGLADAVRAALSAKQGTNSAGQPLPNQLPPRRGEANRSI